MTVQHAVRPTKMQQFRQETSHRDNIHPAEATVQLLSQHGGAKSTLQLQQRKDTSHRRLHQSVLNQQHLQEEQGDHGARSGAANKLMKQFDSARAAVSFLLHHSNLMCLCSRLVLR